MPALRGVATGTGRLRLSLLKEIVIGSDPYEIFKEVNYAFLVGAKPRGPRYGTAAIFSMKMQKIFVEQGKALNAR